MCDLVVLWHNVFWVSGQSYGVDLKKARSMLFGVLQTGHALLTPVSSQLHSWGRGFSARWWRNPATICLQILYFLKTLSWLLCLNSFWRNYPWPLPGVKKQTHKQTKTNKKGKKLQQQNSLWHKKCKVRFSLLERERLSTEQMIVGHPVPIQDHRGSLWQSWEEYRYPCHSHRPVLPLFGIFWFCLPFLLHLLLFFSQ